MSESTARIRFARQMAAGDLSLRLYAILDVESCARRHLAPLEVVRAWRDAGVRLLQLRDKHSSDDDVLRLAAGVANLFARSDTFLLLNDKVHLLAQSGWDGVHVGQGDMPVLLARERVGEGSILGLSTHTPAQVELASKEDVDYVAAGPVFATATKPDAEAIIGTCGLLAARALTGKPLVAIGGITSTRAPEALAAGADCVAVIAGLLEGDPGDCARAYSKRLSA